MSENKYGSIGKIIIREVCDLAKAKTIGEVNKILDRANRRILAEEEMEEGV